MRSRRNLRQQSVRAPQAASEEPRRLCLLHGVLDASGEPVRAVMFGNSRRPVIQALVGFAALAASSGGRA